MNLIWYSASLGIPSYLRWSLRTSSASLIALRFTRSGISGKPWRECYRTRLSYWHTHLSPWCFAIQMVLFNRGKSAGTTSPIFPLAFISRFAAIAIAVPWQATQFSRTSSLQVILVPRAKSSNRFATGVDTNLIGSRSRTLHGPIRFPASINLKFTRDELSGEFWVNSPNQLVNFTLVKLYSPWYLVISQGGLYPAS